MMPKVRLILSSNKAAISLQLRTHKVTSFQNSSSSSIQCKQVIVQRKTMTIQKLVDSDFCSRDPIFICWPSQQPSLCAFLSSYPTMIRTKNRKSVWISILSVHFLAIFLDVSPQPFLDTLSSSRNFWHSSSAQSCSSIPASPHLHMMEEHPSSVWSLVPIAVNLLEPCFSMVSSSEPATSWSSLNVSTSKLSSLITVNWLCR